MRFFALYIAGRYIKAKKSQNAINIMSAIATAGVFVGAAALVIVLSVFNGFESLVTNLYNSFDADYVITPKSGKTFIPDSIQLNKIAQWQEINLLSEVLEENVLLKNGDKQYFATIKGVSPQVANVENLQNLIVDGRLQLEAAGIPYACLGQGVAIGLSLSSSNSLFPLTVYVPNRLTKPDLSNTANAFKILNINVSSVFSVQQDVDSKLFLAPISFTRDLLSYTKEASAIEVYLHENNKANNIQEELQAEFGPNFIVKNKVEQHELLFKIMKSEKWAVFFILVFILIVASFNVIGSLTMLIIDKKKDIAILKSMGATMQSIKNIFLLQGLLISGYGAVAGIITGLIVCFIQLKYGIIGLGGNGTFLIDAYPVKIVPLDIIYVLMVVLLIGFFASIIASKNISKIEEEGLAATIKQD
ncbi:MAG TPA: FtsX-like permease family protein [Bacteroidia bacterium]|nr:FtsX-like permease family protein [Bacteroidia bacterium]